MFVPAPQRQGLRLRILSGLEDLAASVGQRIEALGAAQVEHVASPVDAYEFRHRRDLDPSRIRDLFDAIAPLRPVIRPQEKLSTDADAELYLGMDGDWDQWRLKVYADSERASGRAREVLQSLSFEDVGNKLLMVEQNKLCYGGAPPIVRHALQWWLARELGVTVELHKQWGDDDHDLWLYLRDPEHEGKPLAACFSINVTTDDLESGQALIDHLEGLGFRRGHLQLEAFDSSGRATFDLRPGPFKRERTGTDLNHLRDSILSFMRGAGVDVSHFPLEVGDQREGIEAEFVMPIGLYRSGKLRPYAEGHPARFDVSIYTDDPERVIDMQNQLIAAGFIHTQIRTIEDPEKGFRIRWGSIESYPERTQTVRDAVDVLRALLGADDSLPVQVSTLDDTTCMDIELYLPTQGIADGSLLEKIRSAAASEFDVKVRCADTELRELVLGRLRPRAKFRELKGDSDKHTSAPQIRYGGAPLPLIRWIASIVEAHTAFTEVKLEKAWSDSDHDIWVELPNPSEDEESKPGEESEQKTPPVDLQRWLTSADIDAGRAEAATGLSLLDLQPDRVRVGELWLPRRQPSRVDLVPQAGAFAHYCIDQTTAETLIHVATSAALREPCLLEGETSTSKTSSVLFLASLLNQPVVRLNLNGQTDTGELIGRYVPRDEETGRDADSEEEAAAAKHPWRWQDGLIVQAIKRGWWVVLDEVNLAEPQILERLNSILEREPTLVLSEHDNTVYGTSERPIHPDFRIFATMNPAEYAGRSELSPAYRDRWLGYRFVSAPGEVEYLAMLRHLVYGEQPTVRLQGRSYAGAPRSPVLPNLGEIEHVDAFLLALARFHAALESATRRDDQGTRGLGRHRRERYVFTRRSLLGLMEFLGRSMGLLAESSAVRAMRAALLRYYISRLSSDEDRGTVLQLLDAAGIGPETWTLGQQAPDPDPSADEAASAAEVDDKS
jgi:hypothetical protein